MIYIIFFAILILYISKYIIFYRETNLLRVCSVSGLTKPDRNIIYIIKKCRTKKGILINMLSIIVAKAKNNVIGKDNQLLWHLSDDLKRFKKLTTGHTIIMGRKTFESLGRVLPNRKHIVFTQNPDFKVNDENVQIVHSMLQIQEYIESQEEVFVIGGAMIYNLLMPYVKKMYVTEIDKEFDGDAFFPRIDETKWKEISREKGPEDEENNFIYEYVTYEKR